ncbi:RHS repeat-associated core domain-containing protein [Vibrio ostreae]|uniref:RHS repeat-associated core domain-containing protein n=1 Tax=Vibrio ostreae TaxID=2841925 RepID=UPI0021148A26|nr:RHS repeat-associated core domain-containing protein [Vibrio ostreae]
MNCPNGERWRYRYDAFGRRVAKECERGVQASQQVHYLYDGAQVIQQTLKTANGEALQSTEYIYEPGSFRPLAQVNTHHQLQTEKLHYVVTDHAGTPRELCSENGDIVWRGEQGLWQGHHQTLQSNIKQLFEDAANDPVQCDLRYQGQLEDKESGLYYNLNRYYDADSGQYLSSDPIGMLGGLRPQAYVHNPMEWIEPLGLNSTLLNKNIGGVVGDKLSAHHVIPVEIWKNHQSFFDDIGIGSRRDSVENGILVPGSEKAYKDRLGKGMSVYHSSSHNNYSSDVDRRIEDIRHDYNSGIISKSETRLEVRKLQMELKRDIWSGNVSKNCKGRLN